MRAKRWTTAVVAGLLLAGMAQAQTQNQTDQNQAAPAQTQQAQPAGAPDLQAFINWRLGLPRPGIAQGQTAAQYLEAARAAQTQAQSAYPTPFLDKPLWNLAVMNAEAAVAADRSNMQAVRYLAELYTTVGYWYPAFALWSQMADAGDATARQQAAQAGARVGFLRLNDGQPQAAYFLERSLAYSPNPQVAALLERAQDVATGDE